MKTPGFQRFIIFSLPPTLLSRPRATTIDDLHKSVHSISQRAACEKLKLDENGIPAHLVKESILILKPHNNKARTPRTAPHSSTACCRYDSFNLKPPHKDTQSQSCPTRTHKVKGKEREEKTEDERERERERETNWETQTSSSPIIEDLARLKTVFLYKSQT